MEPTGLQGAVFTWWHEAKREYRLCRFTTETTEELKRQEPHSVTEPECIGAESKEKKEVEGRDGYLCIDVCNVAGKWGEICEDSEEADYIAMPET